MQERIIAGRAAKLGEPATNAEGRLLSIQVLRILAASAVVFQHARVHMGYFDGASDWMPFDRGALGVDLFFVISGFIMVWVTQQSDLSPTQFIKRRLMRVWPLYALITVILGVVVFIAPGWYAGPPDILYIVKSVFFIPAYRPEFGGLYPILVPGWSLNLEIVYYTLFGLALATPNKYVTASVIVTALFLVCSSNMDAGAIPAAYGGRNGIMLEFLVGMLIGVAHVHGFRLSIGTATALLAFGVFQLLTFGKEGLLQAGLPSGLILLAAISLPLNLGERANHWIDLLGRASFALYLIHNPVIQVGARILNRLGYGKGDMDGWLFFAIVFVVSLAGSVVVHLYVEKPLNKVINSSWPFMRYKRLAFHAR